jgi:hypothetical protein
MRPQSTSFTFAILGLILTLPVLLAGLVMLIAGRWPRRRGDEPHCRKCDYLLVGLNSRRCPECGTELTDKNIVQGQRHRRPRLMWAGAALSLLALVTLIPVGRALYQTVDWYQYKPTYFVMQDMDSTAPGTSGRAMTELRRREKAGELSASDQNQLVERALKQQVAAKPAPIATALMDFAARQFADGKLSAQQRKKLLSQTILLTLDVRPTVVVGDDVPFRISTSARVPTLWTVTLRRGAVTVDGNQVLGAENQGFSRMSGFGAGGSTGSRVPAPVVGQHQLEAVAHVEVHQRSGFRAEPSEPLLAEDHKLTGQFTVVSGLPTDKVRPTVDPDLLKQLQVAITPQGFRPDPNVAGRLSGTIAIRNCPVNVAFEVIGRCNGKDYTFNNITCNQGGSTQYLVASNERVDRMPSTIQIILRSSEKGSRQTIDQYDHWNGELVFPDVPVTSADGSSNAP